MNPNPWLRDHDLYVRLGASEYDRKCAYRELFRAQIPETDIHEIQECLAYNHPLGNDRFREQIESTLGKRVGWRQRGRSPKQCRCTKINHYDPFRPPLKGQKMPRFQAENAYA
ncbi:MAG: hypothetical protein ACREXX_04635 [Gammaproteobacteria bacterium]